MARGPKFEVVAFASRAKPLRMNLYFLQAVASNRYSRQTDASRFHFAVILRDPKRAVFWCSCGNRLPPIAANAWVKSPSVGGGRRRLSSLSLLLSSSLQV